MTDPIAERTEQRIPDPEEERSNNAVWVHCAECHHPWVVAYLPMPAMQFANLGKRALCPKGCGGQILIGRGPQPLPTDLTPEQWFLCGDTGLSSRTIYAVMMERPEKNPSWPHDADDFGRCYRLLKRFPEWRHRLLEMKLAHPAWEPFVTVWDELTGLYEAICDVNGHLQKERVPHTYNAFSKCIRAVDDAASTIYRARH